MTKNIGAEVKRNGEEWAKSSRPAKVERVFPRGRSQPDDHAPHGGYLQRKGGEK
jgi:hypothetical protein